MRADRVAIGIGLLMLCFFVSAAVVTAKPLWSSSPALRWTDYHSQISWKPLPTPHTPNVSLHHGRLRLSLGPGTTDVPSGTPFYWASVTHVVDVDTNVYPILAVSVSHLQGPSWWDVDVQGSSMEPGWRNGLPLSDRQALPQPYPQIPDEIDDPGAFDADLYLIGAEVKTPSLNHDGIILFDLPSQKQNGLWLARQQFRIRLNIAGTAPGGSVDYNWIRFISRTEAERMATDPRNHPILVEP